MLSSLVSQKMVEVDLKDLCTSFTTCFRKVSVLVALLASIEIFVTSERFCELRLTITCLYENFDVMSRIRPLKKIYP